jgi:AraC-like DNA-binding protein
MKSRPLQVFCGSVNTTKSANALPNFNYLEISNDISIVTYSATTEEQRLHLKPPKNSFDNSLIIENFNVKCPLYDSYGEDKIVNVVFILKGINFLLSDAEFVTQEVITYRFGSESITQIVLPELLASHLSLLEIKNTQGKAKQVYLRGWAYQLAHAITETLTHLFISQSPRPFKQSDVQKIRLLGYSLKSNLHKSSPSLEEMASMADMSMTKFKTIFKEVYGVSPHQYILDLKLNQAQYLLKQRCLSISEIAYKVGFNHPSALTRLFQNKLGIAPNQVLMKN